MLAISDEYRMLVIEIMDDEGLSEAEASTKARAILAEPISPTAPAPLPPSLLQRLWAAPGEAWRAFALFVLALAVVGWLCFGVLAATIAVY